MAFDLLGNAKLEYFTRFPNKSTLKYRYPQTRNCLRLAKTNQKPKI